MASPKSRAKAPSGARFADAMDTKENPGRYQRNLDSRVKVRTPRVGKGSPLPSPKANPPVSPSTAPPVSPSTAASGASRLGALARGAGRFAGALGAAATVLTPGTANAPGMPEEGSRTRADREDRANKVPTAPTRGTKADREKEDRASKVPEPSKEKPTRKPDRKPEPKKDGPMTDAEIAAWNKKNNKNFRTMKPAADKPKMAKGGYMKGKKGCK